MIAVGVEVRGDGLRAVAVTERGGSARSAEATVGPDVPVEVAVARLADRVGAGAGAATWIAWAGPGVAVERVDVTGAGPADLARLIRARIDTGAAAMATEDGPGGSRRALFVRWDQRAVDRLVRALRGAGFAVAGVVPAVVARAWAPGGHDGAHGAARAAAGLVGARPARSLAVDDTAAPPAQPWVIEPVPPAPSAPAPRSRRRRRWFGTGR